MGCAFRFGRGLVLVAVLAGATEASAGERRLRFDAALAVAEGHPLVASTRDGQRTLAAAQAIAPSLDYNPTVSVTGGPRLLPTSERGFEGRLDINQSIALAGAPRLRREALAAEAEWMGAEVSEKLLERRVRIAQAWLELHEAERLAAMLRLQLETDARIVTLVQALAAAGERTLADVATAEVQLAETRVHIVGAEAAIAEGRSALAAELGPQPEGDLVTEGAAPDVELPSANEQRALLAHASELPAVKVRQLLARSEWVRANEDHASAANRLGVGLSVGRDAIGATVLQAEVSLPLPIFDLGMRAEAAREAAAQQFEGEALDERVRVRTMVATAIHEVSHTAELREVLAVRLVPAAAKAFELRSKQLALGEATVLDVLDARRAELSSKRELARAEYGERKARIKLRLLFNAWKGRP